MTTFEERAKAEAEARWRALNPDAQELTYPRAAIRGMARGAFVTGALWAAAQSGEQPAAEAAPEPDDLRERLTALADGHGERAADCERLAFDPTQRGLATAHRQAERGIRALLADTDSARRAAQTTTEWGVRWPWQERVEDNASEGSARWRAAGNAYGHKGVVVRREVTEWREADR